ncbi:MAG: DUF6726 family protein [Gammaproteobacteria bacterium]
MRKTASRIVVIAVLTSLLSGCFLTKLVTVPMRVFGASVAVVGAVVSVVPVVGNTADSALEKADGAIDGVADTVDEVPL